MKKYSESLKEKVIQKCLQEGRSQSSVEREYVLVRGPASYWIKMHSKECQTKTVKVQEKERLSEYLKIKKKMTN